MATIVTRQAQIYQRQSAEVLHIWPTASQTFGPGQFLKLVSGRLTAHTTAAGTSEEMSYFSLGHAVDPVTNVLNLLTPVVRVRHGMLVEMTFEGVAAIGDQGTNYGLKVTTGVNTVLRSDTTNVALRLVQLPNDAMNGIIGDTNVRALFEVMFARIV